MIKKWWRIAKELKKLGIVGMNQRNAEYILRCNPRHLYPLVDDKLRTKQLAVNAGIAVPDLYAVVQTEHDIRGLPEVLAPYNDFVVKPARGSGGDGIIVVTGRRRQLYQLVNGDFMSEEALGHHISSILSGVYSLGGHADKALIEYRVKFDLSFKDVSYQGVPDIRVIVFRGYPIMAMIRLPTRMSHGKANLHQGAIGAGIDIATGKTGRGVWFNDIIHEHPDTENSIVGLQIPAWDDILNLAAGCYDLTGLGYVGVDIVLDRDLGPLMLELNARPGLNIQIANQAGLAPRLELIQEKVAQVGEKSSVQERVAYAKQVFAVQ